MSHDEFDFEPIPGLPAELPPGEQLLWQGSPTWNATASRVLHIRAVSFYFLAIVILRIVAGRLSDQDWHAIGTSALWLSAFGIATVAFLAWVARMIASGTVYTVTSRRIVMRFGIVVPVTINIPFAIVRSASLKTYDDGTGDIPIQLGGNGRIAYPHLWPHARPWAMKQPEPMLRGVSQAASAAGILALALGHAAR
jgi:Bacterial PH domain